MSDLLRGLNPEQLAAVTLPPQHALILAGAGSAYFERFEIQMTLAQAQSASHQGRCDEDVAELATLPAIARQLRKLDPDTLRSELREYGAWDADELADHDANLARILWIAAGDISEEHANKKPAA